MLGITVTPPRAMRGGTATVANGQTSVVVTHGQAYAPPIAKIAITARNNLGNATMGWVSAVAATTFTITVDTDPGATTAIFSWAILP